jgi:hypothetical protein
VQVAARIDREQINALAVRGRHLAPDNHHVQTQDRDIAFQDVAVQVVESAAGRYRPALEALAE